MKSKEEFPNIEAIEFDNTNDLVKSYIELKNQRDTYKSLIEQYEKIFQGNNTEKSPSKKLSDFHSPTKKYKKHCISKSLNDINSIIKFESNHEIEENIITQKSDLDLDDKVDKLNKDVENFKNILNNENNLLTQDFEASNKHENSYIYKEIDFNNSENNDKNEEFNIVRQNTEQIIHNREIINNLKPKFSVNLKNIPKVDNLEVISQNQSVNNISTIEVQTNFNKLTQKLRDLETKNEELNKIALLENQEKINLQTKNEELNKIVLLENQEKIILQSKINKLMEEISNTRKDSEENAFYKEKVISFIQMEENNNKNKQFHCKNICTLI